MVCSICGHENRDRAKFCDDCGAPMFPNAAGHSVHTESPDEGEEQPFMPLH